MSLFAPNRRPFLQERCLLLSPRVAIPRSGGHRQPFLLDRFRHVGSASTDDQPLVKVFSRAELSRAFLAFHRTELVFRLCFLFVFHKECPSLVELRIGKASQAVDENELSFCFFFSSLLDISRLLFLLLLRRLGSAPANRNRQRGLLPRDDGEHPWYVILLSLN